MSSLIRKTVDINFVQTLVDQTLVDSQHPDVLRGQFLGNILILVANVFIILFYDVSCEVMSKCLVTAVLRY